MFVVCSLVVDVCRIRCMMCVVRSLLRVALLFVVSCVVCCLLLVVSRELCVVCCVVFVVR